MRILLGILVFCIATGLAAAAHAQAPVINEVVRDHWALDIYECIEVFAAPNTDLSACTVLGINGNDTNAGTIDLVYAVGTTDSAGVWWPLFRYNEMDNGTLSFLLVVNFTGLPGNDLDGDDDGTLDATPWDSVLDAVALWDGEAMDHTYADVVLDPNFDGLGQTVGGASRIPNGTDTGAVSDWARNDFLGSGLPGFSGQPSPGQAFNTPGAVNSVAIPEPATIALAALGGLALLLRRPW